MISYLLLLSISCVYGFIGYRHRIVSSPLNMMNSESSLRIRRMKEIVSENEDQLRSIDAVKIIKVCFEDFMDIRRILPISRLASIIDKCELNLDIHELTGKFIKK